MSDIGLATFAARPKKTATDQIFETLYKAVIALELPPGTKVSEAEIAKMLDVSRQPVRDAFYRLSKLGFLSMRPQRATLVTKISELAVRNAVFIRTALEVESLRTALEQSGDDLIAKLRDNLRQQASETDLAEFHLLDENFHQIICDCAGHPHVWTLIQEQKAHMDRVRYLSLSQARREVVLKEHERVIEALEAGDIDGAETHFRAHLSGVFEILEQTRSAHPDYFGEEQ